MLLVSCGNDVKFHSSSQYDVVQVYRPTDCSGLLRSISWCRDGTLLSLVPFKGNAEIIRTKDDVKVIQSIMGVCQPTASAFQRTTKKHVALGTLSGNIVVYDIKARATKKIFVKSGPPITMLEWNYKDTHLATLNTEGELSLYSNLNNQKTSTVKIGASRSISTMRFHQTHKNLLACASDDGAVAVWDNNTSKTKFFSQIHKAPVTDLVFSSQNNSLLTSVALDRSFLCYDSNEGEVALSVLTDQPLSAIDMAPNGHTIAVASIRGTIYIYDLRQYKAPMKTIQAHSGEIKRVLYQPQESGSVESIKIPEETVIETESIQRNSSVDSFAQMINSVNEFSPRVDYGDNKTPNLLKRRSESMGDSFLAELSPARKALDSYTDNTNELSNLGLTDGVKKWIDSKNNIMDSSIPHHSGVLDVHKEISSGMPSLHNKTSSTPRLNNKPCYIQNEDIQDSPIAMDVPQTSNVNIEEIRKIVKEVVTEVATDQMTEIMDGLSRYFLNLQMSFSKQFVNQEAALQKLLHSQPNHNNLLAQLQLLKEENEFLKKKLNEKFKQGE